MNLYEINQAIANFEFEIDEETGEVLNTEELDNLEMSRGEKIENIGCLIKNLKAFCTDVKAEEAALKERREAAEKKAERLKTYLASVLNGEKFNTPKVAITWRNSNAVEIGDSEALLDWITKTGHDECLTFKAPTISKTAVGDLIKDGVEVPGASIEARTNIQIK